MSKPRPVHLDAGDCAVPVDGETFFPHEGEWVELYRGMSVAGITGATALLNTLPDTLGSDDLPRINKVMEHDFVKVCEMIANRVTDWSWTDDAGDLLPNPHNRGDVIQTLRAEEIGWLLNAIQGETPTERKNGSKPLPNTSLTKVRNRRRQS